jgi:hypothetical protein
VPGELVAQYQRYLLDTHPAFADDRAIALLKAIWKRSIRKSAPDQLI